MKNVIYERQFDPVSPETIGIKMLVTRENNGGAVWKITDGAAAVLVQWFPTVADVKDADAWNAAFEKVTYDAIEKVVDDVRAHELTL